MQGKSLRIVFMGTPELASYCLKHLVDEGYQVVGVVTAPDKPSGRGRKMSQSPVKQLAMDLGLPLLQPEKLKNPEFVEALRALKPDLQVVVAFRMLPEVVWALPPWGSINMHASLLPDYRGAAPINWAIIHGEQETGITTFRLTHQIDTGNILLQERIPIDDAETAGSLHEKMKSPAARLITRTIDGLARGTIQPINQEDLIVPGRVLHEAPKIFREHGAIDLTQSGVSVVQLIRGLSPAPAAYHTIYNKQGDPLQMKIFQARFLAQKHALEPGMLITDNKNEIRLACSDGFIIPEYVQLPGKKPMAIDVLLRGFDLNAWLEQGR